MNLHAQIQLIIAVKVNNMVHIRSEMITVKLAYCDHLHIYNSWGGAIVKQEVYVSFKLYKYAACCTGQL